MNISPSPWGALYQEDSNVKERGKTQEQRSKHFPPLHLGMRVMQITTQLSTGGSNGFTYKEKRLQQSMASRLLPAANSGTLTICTPLVLQQRELSYPCWGKYSRLPRCHVKDMKHKLIAQGDHGKYARFYELAFLSQCSYTVIGTMIIFCI